MNIFIKRLIIFSSVFIIYLGANSYLNSLIFRNSELPFNKAEIIIAGDSHTERAINPEQFTSAVNISKSAEPYILTYWKLEYIFKHYKPKILFLGFAPHNISAYNELKFSDEKWANEMFKRSYIIGDFSTIDDVISINYKEFYKIYLKEMCLYPHKDHFNFIGSYSNFNKSDFSNLKSIIQRHYYYKDKRLKISKITISFLDNIINLCKEKGIKLVLIGTPVTKKYYDSIPDVFKNTYNLEKQRLKKDGILVADYTRDFYQDSLYLNSDHLNRSGALQFSNTLNELLKDINAQIFSINKNLFIPE